ncbi:MAG: DNA polymerase III subunit delta' [Cycloclasticus sp. symbiont of Bathymodiolus heckerae]|nr:MAG: DNA polymerase III subunit delta' [Cycloclasticus sp. symbiont of Bathymodiolus heckerae]
MSSQTSIVYPWLRGYWGRLSRYQAQDRLPSAIMLVGSEGLGLLEFATAFAGRTFCLSAQANGLLCGECASCLLFNAGNYPDFFHLDPEEGKASIKIDAIRKLSEALALSSQYAKPRVVVINPATAMLHQAANSLLKTLEEPSENTCLILIADKVSKISATIRSRCQIITIKNIDLSEAENWLKNQGCEKAKEYLNLANHLPILAYELWQKEALVVRTEVFKDFMSLVKGQLDPLLFAGKCVGLKGFPVLTWLTSWLTDAIKCSNNPEDSWLLNPDLKDDLKVLAETLNLSNIHKLLEKLGQLINLESSQVNQQLLLEDFAIQCYSLKIK